MFKVSYFKFCKREERYLRNIKTHKSKQTYNDMTKEKKNAKYIYIYRYLN